MRRKLSQMKFKLSFVLIANSREYAMRTNKLKICITEMKAKTHASKYSL